MNKTVFYNILAVTLYTLLKYLKIIEIILSATLISSWNISTYQLEIKHQNSAVAFKYVNTQVNKPKAEIVYKEWKAACWRFTNTM